MGSRITVMVPSSLSLKGCTSSVSTWPMACRFQISGKHDQNDPARPDRQTKRETIRTPAEYDTSTGDEQNAMIGWWLGESP